MKKFGFLFCLIMLAIVFCLSVQGEMITEIQDNKIFVFEKTKIKEGVLPSKDFGISDEIAKELFSGQKEKHIFDSEIITNIDFFNWSFFPKASGKTITKRVVYSDKVGWISEVLKEIPTEFPLKLIAKVVFSLMIGILITAGFLLKKILKTMQKGKEPMHLRILIGGSVGVIILILYNSFFKIFFPEVLFFLEYLLWNVANVVVIITTYYILKFCVSRRKRKIREKEKMEDEKRRQDSARQTIQWIGQKHRD